MQGNLQALIDIDHGMTACSDDTTHVLFEPATIGLKALYLASHFYATSSSLLAVAGANRL